MKLFNNNTCGDALISVLSVNWRQLAAESTTILKTMNTIKSAISIHEDNSGIFYRLHLESNKGGFSEVYDQKPSIDLIQERADWLNHNEPCILSHEFATV